MLHTIHPTDQTLVYSLLGQIAKLQEEKKVIWKQWSDLQDVDYYQRVEIKQLQKENKSLRAVIKLKERK